MNKGPDDSSRRLVDGGSSGMKLQEVAPENAIIGAPGGVTVESIHIKQIPLEMGLIFIVAIAYMDLINELCIMIISFKVSGLIGVLCLVCFLIVAVACAFFTKNLFFNAVKFDRNKIVSTCKLMVVTKIYMVIVMIISLFAAAKLRSISGYWIFYYLMSIVIWLYITF